MGLSTRLIQSIGTRLWSISVLMRSPVAWFLTVRRIGGRRRNGRKYYWRKMRRRFFVESRRGQTFQAWLPRSAAPCEADEQRDGKANGGQLETYEEDRQVPSQQEEGNMALQLARSYV